MLSSGSNKRIDNSPVRNSVNKILFPFTNAIKKKILRNNN